MFDAEGVFFREDVLGEPLLAGRNQRNGALLGPEPAHRFVSPLVTFTNLVPLPGHPCVPTSAGRFRAVRNDQMLDRTTTNLVRHRSAAYRPAGRLLCVWSVCGACFTALRHTALLKNVIGVNEG